MTRVYMDWIFNVVTDGPTEELEAQAGRVMEELLNLEDANLTDAAVSLDLAAQTIEIEISSTAQDHDQAVQRGMSCIRAAIHAAGGATPNWPGMREGVMKTEPVPA